MSKPRVGRVDGFRRHEAMDRAWLAYGFVERALAEHTGCKANKKAYAKVKIATQALWDAYQAYAKAAL